MDWLKTDNEQSKPRMAECRTCWSCRPIRPTGPPCASAVARSSRPRDRRPAPRLSPAPANLRKPRSSNLAPTRVRIGPPLLTLAGGYRKPALEIACLFIICTHSRSRSMAFFYLRPLTCRGFHCMIDPQKISAGANTSTSEGLSGAYRWTMPAEAWWDGNTSTSATAPRKDNQPLCPIGGKCHEPRLTVDVHRAGSDPENLPADRSKYQHTHEGAHNGNKGRHRSLTRRCHLQREERGPCRWRRPRPCLHGTGRPRTRSRPSQGTPATPGSAC